MLYLGYCVLSAGEALVLMLIGPIICRARISTSGKTIRV